MIKYIIFDLGGVIVESGVKIAYQKFSSGRERLDIGTENITGRSLIRFGKKDI